MLLLIVMAGPAWAKKPKKKPTAAEKAEVHKEEAFRRFNSGDFAGGIAEMEQAHALVQHPGFLLNIAVGYERWEGHCEDALATLERFFAECGQCKLLADARERQRKLRTKCVGRLEIRSEPEGAMLAVDDRPRGETPASLELAAGEHHLEISLRGYRSASRKVRLKEGATETVVLALLPVEPPKVAPPPPPPPPALITEAPEPEAQGGSPAPWISFGVAAAGVALGAVYTVKTLGTLDERDLAIDLPQTKTEIQRLEDQATNQAVVAHVGYGVAAAGIVAGVLFLIFDGAPAESGAVAVRF